MKAVIFYICDRKACRNCSERCKYTADITHAVNPDATNFKLMGTFLTDDGIKSFLFEKEPQNAPNSNNLIK